MEARILLVFLLGIHIFFGLEAMEDVAAKNGRLPQMWGDALGEPAGFPSEPEKHSQLIPEYIAEYVPEKRNVAALARLGRLNSIRYGRFLPHFVNGKRVSSEEDNKVEKNELVDIDIECLPYDDEEINVFLNGKQKKRYVAALARSGRLPIWHSQRMWGGRKRDDSYPTFRRMDIDNDMDNSISEMPDFKQKICKKIYGYKRQKRSVEQFTEEENTSGSSSNNPDFDIQEEKRNVAALARNGKLPLRRFGKRNENVSEIEIIPGNIAENRQNNALTQNEEFFQSSNLQDKKNIAALARNEKIPSFRSMEMKRNIASLARNGKLFTQKFSGGKRNFVTLDEREFNIAEKRNMAALARNGKLPSFYRVNGKRNIQALARNGKLPAFTDKKRNSDELEQEENILDQYIDDKRNVAARNGKMPSFNEDKRNVAALARNGKLPALSTIEEKRNLNGEGNKRNIASLARNGKLRAFNSNGEKRTIEKLKMAEGKRNVAALARNGKLPMFNSGEDKRNLAARKLDINGKRYLAARNNKLPAFYNSAEKRNIASLAQRGTAFNKIEKKRLPETYYEKRNIAARHFHDLGGNEAARNQRENYNISDEEEIF